MKQTINQENIMKQQARLCFHRLIAGLIIGAILCTPAVAHRFDTVNVHTWETKAAADFFPEMDDPRVNVKWLKERPSFGIAFSGGGTRSATATLGQLRALKHLGWIDQARYISANSGGSWTSVPYTYLPKDLDENHFLGAYVPPEKITDAVLTPKSTADQLTMSSAIYRSRLGTKLFSILKGDETYADVIGKVFLKPFGLHNRKKVFTFHNKALQATLQGNEDLSAADFYTVREARPYLIAVGSLRVPVKSQDKSELFLLETTPLYTGVRNEFKLATRKKSSEILIGGGYVESFGYDSYEPKAAQASDGLWKVRLEGDPLRGDLKKSNKRYRFTLSDIIGMSGAAPSITIADKHVPAGVFPEFRHWAVNRKKVLNDKNLRNKAKELKHGDGGDIDNLALMPLLARKVENILVFINTRTAFQPDTDCSNITTKALVDDLISLFRPTEKLVNNVVIDDPEGAKLEALCRAFVTRKKKADPLVYCDQYPISDNHRQAVRGKDYQPSICWVYLDRTGKWIGKIEASGGKKTRQLKTGQGAFDRFPHYRTFSEKKGVLIDLNPERVHALSNMSAWTVIESKNYLAEKLAGASLATENNLRDAQSAK